MRAFFNTRSDFYMKKTAVGPSLAASLEPLAHCRNVASLSLFYR